MIVIEISYDLFVRVLLTKGPSVDSMMINDDLVPHLLYLKFCTPEMAAYPPCLRKRRHGK